MGFLIRILDFIIDTLSFIGLFWSLVWILTHQKEFKRDTKKFSKELTGGIKELLK
jgi:hypothetical protein